jgi:L-alanine-DL-glutamate epimerase-like enolase superfamily enzyme
VAPHLWGGAVLFASGLHLATALPCVTTLEFSRGENALLNDLVTEPFDLVDGYVIPNDRPGLGITLNRDFVRAVSVPS